VILLTALTHRDALLMGWEAGADEYLFKPFHPSELKARVRSMLALVEARQQREEERERRREFEDFAYVASHDLREPLRVMTTCAQMLRRKCDGRLDPGADEYLGFIVDGADRMRRLIDDLISYSLASSPEAAHATVDANVALADALQNLQSAVRESGAVVTAANLPRVQGNLAQLTRLFQNLIANSIKYRSHRPPAIRIHAEAGERDWLVSVVDNGIGFDQKYTERVFAPFKRLHGPAQYSGTGIGLAICRRIVQNHGGRIWAESAPGRGSTFSFTLSRAPTAPAAAEADSIAAPAGA
jgi:light-regulated signal transduction histidine kinase (bacteriophytochrome)